MFKPASMPGVGGLFQSGRGFNVPQTRPRPPMQGQQAPMPGKRDIEAEAQKAVIEQGYVGEANQKDAQTIVNQTVETVAQEIVNMQNLMRNKGLSEQKIEEYTFNTIKSDIAGIEGGYAKEERDEIAARVFDRVQELQPPEAVEKKMMEFGGQPGPGHPELAQMPPQAGMQQQAAMPQQPEIPPGMPMNERMGAPMNDASWQAEDDMTMEQAMDPGVAYQQGANPPPMMQEVSGEMEPMRLSAAAQKEQRLREKMRMEKQEAAEQKERRKRLRDILGKDLTERAKAILDLNMESRAKLTAKEKENATEAVKTILASSDVEVMLDAIDRLLDAGVYNKWSAPARTFLGSQIGDMYGDPEGEPDPGNKPHWLPDDRVAQRTLEVEQIATVMALKQMNEVLKGQTTDFELKQFVRLYADKSMTLQQKQSAVQQLRIALKAEKAANVVALREMGLLPPEIDKSVKYQIKSPMPGDNAPFWRGTKKILDLPAKGGGRVKIPARYIGGDVLDIDNSWERLEE